MTLPGLTAVVERPPADPEPLRTDIALFAGRTVRGPVGEATSVAGWREYQSRYGGLASEGLPARSTTPFSVRSYFDNGGEVAWIVRLEGSAATAAEGSWTIGEVLPEGGWALGAPANAGFPTDVYRIVASSPGSWANGARVLFELQVLGSNGKSEVDVRVELPGEETEYFARLDPAVVAEEINARSGYVRLESAGVVVATKTDAPRGPLSVGWTVDLANGTDATPSAADYLTGARTIADLDEPAIVAIPDLAADLTDPVDRNEVAARVAGDAAVTLDRLVLLDVPPEHLRPAAAIDWADQERTALNDSNLWRAVAVYHPSIRVDDPHGGLARPLRTIPPSGAVAGVISRLDRERGPHHTPANAVLYQIVDVAEAFEDVGQSQLFQAGINNLRCSAGRGIEVWGGRTLDPDPMSTFVAHRRLLHRLVRAARRVAEPLVFDVNGPELWFTVHRTLNTVLLEAYRSGGLKGRTPDEAYRVQCDEELNPLSERDSGRVLCLVSVAPATPMEFIVLRLSFGLQGVLEVVEQ